MAKRKPVDSAKPNDWQIHVESWLSQFKEAYESGYPEAFWDLIIFCNDTSTKHPTWVRDVLIGLINGQQLKKRKEGRPRDWLQDFVIFGRVNYWLGQRREFGKARKVRRFSQNEAFKSVQQEMGGYIEIDKIRATYKRCKGVLRAKAAGLKPYGYISLNKIGSKTA